MSDGAIVGWLVPVLAAFGTAAWRRAAARERRNDARQARLRALLDSVAELSHASRRSSQAVLEVLDRTVREFAAGVDGVLVFAPAGEELTCVYANGARVEHFRGFAIRNDDPKYLPSRAAQTGCRALVPADGAALVPTDRFAIAVPMLDGRSLLSIAYVSSLEHLAAPAADAIVEAIERAAAPFAIALEREADRAHATHDGLTGLFSSRAFRIALRDEVARAVASGRQRSLCVWFVDTDRFKEVNDRFGHRAGDAVLQVIASILESQLTADVDFAARNGGDEFCALLRGVSKSRAIERAQAFCHAVRAHDFGIPVRITASVGIAAYPRDATNSTALLEVADAAMYHSKHDGRDRVSFALAPGSFASLPSEAASDLSRSPSRWRSSIGESFAARWSP
ncbi:MAG: GGDEF domain-containing protein [Candidatus Tumulicola sp.]